MMLFTILRTMIPDLDESRTKIHLAVWNGEDNPLDVYLAGDFEEWQAWQNKQNFKREYIVSLIKLPGVDKWLFSGAFSSFGSEYSEEHGRYKYETSELDGCKQLAGRIIVEFKRSGRASYLLAENCSDCLFISEILPEKMVVEDFKAYSLTSIDKSILDIIVRQNITSWRTALSVVSGVYLITDQKTGKLYVGSATGDGGFWQRWSDYSYSGHGNNGELRELLATQGFDYCENFKFSILEIADTHTSSNLVLERESYWKNVLCTREFGYNSN